MTPSQRKAAHAKFLSMLPTPERQSLLEAIQTSDRLDQAIQKERETSNALARASVIHDAAVGRRQTLEQAHTPADVAALFERLEIELDS